jgi:hypothetical protein
VSYGLAFHRMKDTLIDIGGSLLAVLLCAPVVGLPGFALAGGAGGLGFWQARAGGQFRLALIAAFALLPAIDSLAARLLGLDVALWLNLGLAVCGVGVLVKAQAIRGGRLDGASLRRVAGLAVALLVWTALIGYAYWDFELGGRLYQSIADTDMVKHAATIQALADTGAPPADPFVARPGPSGYYYFFYTLGALVERLGLGWVDARAAFVGVAIWVGPALVALAVELLVRCGYVTEDAAGPTAPTALRRHMPLLIALLLVSALDILPILLLGAGGLWAPTLGAWNDEVTPWLISLIWVPHHVTGLIAIWAGLLALEEVVRPKGSPPPGRGRVVRSIVFAALAFASAAGASVWVTLAGVGAIGLWLAVLAWERRGRAVALVLAAGVLAAVFLLPQMHDLATGRGDHAMPIALTIRDFKMLDAVIHNRLGRAMGRLLLLPLNYGLELGVFLLGGVLFLRRATRADIWDREVPRLLTLTAVSGVLLGTFAKSTIIYNDLGWRVMLFPQLALLLWTTVALRRQLDTRRIAIPQAGAPRLFVNLSWVMLFVFGYMTTAYALFGLRGYRVLTPPKFIFSSPLDPAIHDQMRETYGWLARHIPPRTVVQQNPTPKRVLDFGLYGRNPVAVADRDATLYGAPKALVRRRLHILRPVFNTGPPAWEAAVAARAAGVDVLIAKATDPAWRLRQSWVWAVPPLYATPMVRVVPVARLEAIKRPQSPLPPSPPPVRRHG